MKGGFDAPQGSVILSMSASMLMVVVIVFMMSPKNVTVPSPSTCSHCPMAAKDWFTGKKRGEKQEALPARGLVRLLMGLP